MNIVDALIIIILILGIMSGFRRGFIKQTVLLLGLIATVVVSFYLRLPVATFMYKNLPFFSFGGIFKGVSVLNILLYEILAFLIVFSVMYLILRILLKISGIIESILKATVILGFFSKLAGGVVGFIESYIIIFIAVFILSQPFVSINEFDRARLPDKILISTPFMSESISNTKKVIDEVKSLSNTYKNDSSNFNKAAIELFLKYEIVSEENINYLREKGKLD